MPELDVTQIDFSEHAPGQDAAQRRVAHVRNEDARAVLHVGVRSPAPWLELYPAEFALAPQSSQPLTVEMHPERARNQTLAPAEISVFGQYIAVDAAEVEALPPDMEARITVLPPVAACPNCGADLPEGARECRRCGERIRLCPFCGTPNTWLARTCRRNPAHILRQEADWLAAPGGDAAHALALRLPLGIHLARRWSSPSFAPGRDAPLLEWSAPLLAFGMVFASAIDTAAGRATVTAFDITNGALLWEFDLPDSKGLYPDRGAMALSEDGTLYAATLGGQVVALDAIRGTRRWAMALNGAVYGGVTVAGEWLLVPAGNTLCALDRQTGVLLRSLPLGARLDTAPAFADGIAYAACDDACVYAWDGNSDGPTWQAAADGPFDAAPLIKDGVVYTASMAGTVSAWDARTGTAQWKTSVTARGLSVSPALSADGLLFVAADDGFVHIVTAASGNLIRSRRISAAPLRTAPVCSGATVFVGADDGSLYALDADYAVQRVYETIPGARVTGAGLALGGDTLACITTNGVLHVLQAIA